MQFKGRTPCAGDRVSSVRQGEPRSDSRCGAGELVKPIRRLMAHWHVLADDEVGYVPPRDIGAEFCLRWSRSRRRLC
jgi:hypothetical protein